MTPLMHAARGDHQAVVTVLLGAGADPRIKDIVSMRGYGSAAVCCCCCFCPNLVFASSTQHLPQSGTTAEMHALRCNSRATASLIQNGRPPVGN